MATGPIADELAALCGPWFAYRHALLPNGAVTVDQLHRWAEDWWHAEERRPTM